MQINSTNTCPCYARPAHYSVSSARNPISLRYGQAMRWLFTGIMLTVMLVISSQSYADDVNLTIKNRTGQAVRFYVQKADCIYVVPEQPVEGTYVADGGEFSFIVFRDALASACSGKNGHFYLTSSYGPGVQHFRTTNHYVWPTSAPGSFAGTLELEQIISGTTGVFSWTMRDVDARLASPADDRLTMPRKHIAYDTGSWGRVDVPNSTVKYSSFNFNQDGTPIWGSVFDTCGGYPLYHPQHVVRLPNKNGRAYFMVAQSRQHNGYIFLVETYEKAINPATGLYERVLDPNTDRLNANLHEVEIGKMIWQDLYTGVFNENFNPIGNWNHPGKMSVMGGVLVVAAQNWSEDNGFVDSCTWSTSNPYQIGTSEDAVLFYDVRDPENPRYWGSMTATELRLPSQEYTNGTYGSGRGGYKPQIDIVSLFRNPQSGKWRLTAGKSSKGEESCAGPCGREYSWPAITTWETDSVSPNIADWQVVGATFEKGNLIPEAVPALPAAIYPSGQHGDEFLSYEWESQIIYPAVNRREHVIIFDSADGNDSGDNDGFAFNDYGSDLDNWIQNAADNAPYKPFAHMGIPESAEVHWVSDTIHVTTRGEPVVYTLENDAIPDGDRGNHDAYLYQVYDTQNNVENRTPPAEYEEFPPRYVTTASNNLAGSLRDAVGYGGLVIFDTGLMETSTIDLGAAGPLIVSLYDVELEQPANTKGITLIGNGVDAVIRVADGKTLKMNNIKTTGDPLADLLNGNSTHLPWATSLGNGWMYAEDGAVRSADRTQGKDEHFLLQTAVTGPGTLTFDWKIESYYPVDTLQFTVNENAPAAGFTINTASIANSYTPKSVSLDAGNHQLRWIYTSVSADSGDFAYVRNVVFTPAAPVFSQTIPASVSYTQGVSDNSLRLPTANTVPTTYSVTAGALPDGLYLHSTTGQIFGSAGELGSFDVTITVANAGGSDSIAMTIDVAPSPITVRSAIDVPFIQPNPVFFTDFFGQTAYTQDGVDAAQTKSIAHNQCSELKSVFYGAGKVSYYWKVSSQPVSGVDGDVLSFEHGTAGARLSISGEQDWQQVTNLEQTEGSDVIWRYCKDPGGPDGGLDAGWVDQVFFEPSLANSLESPESIDFSSSGDALWVGTSTATQGIPDVCVGGWTGPLCQPDSAQSGDISDGGISRLFVESITGPATLTFWWKVSSEATYDKLIFSVDDNFAGVDAISGEKGWEEVTVSIPAGDHKVSWIYIKDGIESAGEDRGWVDHVSLTPGHHITSSLTASATAGEAFAYQITAANQPTSYRASLDGNSIQPEASPVRIGLTVDNTGLISGIPMVTGIINLTLTAFSSDWPGGEATLELTIGESLINTSVALDDAALAWSSVDPATTWFAQASETHDGTDAIRSNYSGNLQESELNTTVTGPGMLSFWWKVSSQDGDYLQFRVDNKTIRKISGTTEAWQKYTVAIDSGVHILSWVYEKDLSGFDGEDAGWLDEVLFTSGLVLNNNDSGAGSLRQTIADLPAGGTINFHADLAGDTTTLEGTQLSLTKDVMIDASGLEGGLIISGNSDPAKYSRVFSVSEGVHATIDSITISNGNAYDGGGISNTGGDLEIIDTTLTGNHADRYGGALFNFSTASFAATTTIINSTLDNNSSGESGGAIYIGNDNVSGVSLVNSTLSGNSASQSGGGIHNYLGNINLDHCTMANNSALSGNGGAISSGGGSVSIENSILAANTASNSAADIYTNTIVTVIGKSLIGSNFTVETEFPDTDPLVGNSASPLNPLLGALTDNGGPTHTIAPLFNSPAVDAALPGTAVYLGDQRGEKRYGQGAATDVGALELADSDGDGLIDAVEIEQGTSPYSVDSDGDGLLDGAGGKVGKADYAGVDLNGDNLVDGEADFGTDPVLSDSDGDRIDDGDEISIYGINPLVSNVGDVAPLGNPDNQINIGDLLILQSLIHRRIEPGVLELILGDINSDDELNLVDVLLLEQTILNE